jgi:hypothetical protein
MDPYTASTLAAACPELIEVDSSGNRVVAVATTCRTPEGDPITVARLANDPERGYLAVGDGCFGTTECPSSYGYTVACWFGVGESFPDATAALNAVAAPLS